MQNLNQIINKRLIFKLQNDDKQSINRNVERANKYQNRGFNVINNYTVQELSKEQIFVYKVKSIDKEHNIYQLTGGTLDTLQDVSKFIYPEKVKDKCGIIKKGHLFDRSRAAGFDILYENDNDFEIKILNEHKLLEIKILESEDLTESNNNVKYLYCDYCGKDYSLHLYNEILEYYICVNCIKRKKLLEETFSIFKQISENQPNIIYLSDSRRNTEIDYYVKFCYPNDNTRTLWCDKQYHLFIID